MEQSKYEGWQTAPIDNKNILEDFADDVCYTCDDNGNRKTFWKHGSLFVVDYDFGSNIAYIHNVYGKKDVRTAEEIKKELEQLENDDDDNRSTVCEITVEGFDVKLAFFFKPDELIDKNKPSREDEVLEALEKMEDGLNFEETSVVVPLFDECHEKYGERIVNLDYAYAYYGEIRVEGNHYDVGDDFNIADLPTVSQNALYKAIFKALEQQKDRKEEKS